MEVTLRRTAALVARTSVPLHPHTTATTTAAAVALTTPSNRRPLSFSSLTRPPPNYPGHVPLSGIERFALTIGSGLGSLINPYRGGKLLPSNPQPTSFPSS
jgi:ubiquinone biosynthesis protein COQ4